MAQTILAPRKGDIVSLAVRWGAQSRLRCCNRYLPAQPLVFCPSCQTTYQPVPGSDQFLVVNSR